jgi:DUF971 family protein
MSADANPVEGGGRSAGRSAAPPVPTAIARIAHGVEIAWSDGARSSYGTRLLRDACPCATCREKRAAPVASNPLLVLAPADIAPLAIVGMKPVGQYAYSIEFSDGHSSGIYTLDYLRELGGPRPDSGAPPKG